jgi:hypothetical protein
MFKIKSRNSEVIQKEQQEFYGNYSGIQSKTKKILSNYLENSGILQKLSLHILKTKHYRFSKSKRCYAKHN